MEFRFNISKIFKSNISRIGNSLLPAGFVAADRRTALDTTAYVAEIINTIGQASAAAQGLNQAVTTADRLRNADDQVIYLMTEDNDKTGLVVGMLKIGHKSLYVFDKFGETRHVNAPCVLDFYIHESRQRAGFGKILFENMLEFESLLPENLAIDRPSEKLLGFLRKHYALTQKIPQSNNFVIYDGFFASQESQKEVNGTSQMHIQASPNSHLFGPQFVAVEKSKRRSNSRSRQEPLIVQNTVHGRYGAPRPQCSLNQIIHNKPSTAVTTEPSSKPNHEAQQDEVAANTDEGNTAYDEELARELQSLDATFDEPPQTSSPIPSFDHVTFGEDEIIDSLDAPEQEYQHEQKYYNHIDHQQPHSQEYAAPHRAFSPFQYNKRMTGKKNISSIVVGSDNKMEFNQIDDRGFGVVKIHAPLGAGMSTSHTGENLNDTESIHSRDSDISHTADGFFDLKFYSHPLW